jgi:hypothetical protein
MNCPPLPRPPPLINRSNRIWMFTTTNTKTTNSRNQFSILILSSYLSNRSSKRPFTYYRLAVEYFRKNCSCRLYTRRKTYPSRNPRADSDYVTPCAMWATVSPDAPPSCSPDRPSFHLVLWASCLHCLLHTSNMSPSHCNIKAHCLGRRVREKSCNREY